MTRKSIWGFEILVIFAHLSVEKRAVLCGRVTYIGTNLTIASGVLRESKPSVASVGERQTLGGFSIRVDWKSGGIPVPAAVKAGAAVPAKPTSFSSFLQALNSPKPLDHVHLRMSFLGPGQVAHWGTGVFSLGV